MGYIGDVTKTSERTMMISILQALGSVMMPLADFIGGQVYKAGKKIKRLIKITIKIDFNLSIGGFAPVYFFSLGFIFIGLIYIWIIPESVTRRQDEEEEEEDVDLNANEVEKVEKKPKKSLWCHFMDTNKLLLQTIRYIFRYIYVIGEYLQGISNIHLLFIFM